jgi:hypothetical protein
MADTDGATTMNIMTRVIMTLTTMTLGIITLSTIRPSIMTLGLRKLNNGLGRDTQQNTFYCFFMMNVIMLHAMLVDVVMQNVIMQKVVLLNVILLNVSMPSVTTLNDFPTSVVAPILTNTNFDANFW